MPGKFFTIRKENVKSFIAEMIFDKISARNMHGETSSYNLMKDEFIIQKNNPHGIKEGDQVQIIIDAHSPVNKYELNHIYMYIVHLYDDVSYLMELIDFKVDAILKESK